MLKDSRPTAAFHLRALHPPGKREEKSEVAHGRTLPEQRSGLANNSMSAARVRQRSQITFISLLIAPVRQQIRPRPLSKCLVRQSE
jgi:hypothetical protein